MSHPEIETFSLAFICGVAAWWIVRQFVMPWQRSKDKTLAGRVNAVLGSMDEHQARAATVFGSRGRTLFVTCVNIAGLVAVLLAAVHLTIWVMLYPLVGFAVLAVLRVRTDRRMFSDATLVQRFEARLHQSWSWPVVLFMVLGGRQP